jgi:hypothetical protein
LKKFFYNAITYNLKRIGGKKMSKQSNHFEVTVFLVALLVLSIHLNFVGSVNASEPDLQDRTVSILDDVVGVKTEDYTITNSVERTDNYLNVPKKCIDMTLFSADNRSFRVYCCYVKNELSQFYLGELDGEISMKKSVANTVEITKGFLETYQTFTGESVYGDFASMLDDVKANVELTKIAGNAKMEVSVYDQNSVTYSWTYIDEDGALAERKNLNLLYEQGMFKGFINTWPLYTIVDTPKISSERALTNALAASETYSYAVVDKNGTERMVSANFSIAPESLGYEKLVYLNSEEQEYARDGDPFKLYPTWFIPLGFDQFYPGDVSGLNIILWADSGKVCGMNRVITENIFAEYQSKETPEEPTPQQVNTQSNALPVAVVVAVSFGIAIAAIRERKKLARMKTSNLLAMVLCSTIVFSAMLPIPFVNAAVGKSRLYACLWGNGYENYHADRLERQATIEVCAYIANITDTYHYSTSNLCGSTIAAEVVAHAGEDTQTFWDTMVFYAGHESSSNTAIQDHDGDPIESDAIFDQTDTETYHEHFFNLLWVCVMAEDHTSGMPRAWTHRENLSEYGYTASDGEGQCYISFKGFSPMLSNHYSVYGGNYSVFYEHNDINTDVGPCKEFIKAFYKYAFDYGMTVKMAINWASLEYFEEPYVDSVLYRANGYNSWWPGGDWDYVDEYGIDYSPLCRSGYYPIDFTDLVWVDPENPEKNSMRIFGDANIKLRYYEGDYNHDEKLNFQDINSFVNNYILFYLRDEYHPEADFNDDRIINFNDINRFVNIYISYFVYGLDGQSKTLGGTKDGGNQTALVGLSGPDLVPNVGENFNITLRVQNATELWGWGSALSWDCDVLELTNITEASFLSSADNTMFLTSINSNATSNGTLQDMGSSLMSNSSVNGSGDLATLTFQVLSCEPTTINITDVQLYAPEMQQISSSSSNLTIHQDILVTNITPQKSFVQTGGFTLPVNVTLQNLCNFTQEVTVQVYANSSLFHTESFNVTGDGFTTVTCMCNTTSYSVGNYNLMVYAFPNHNETSTFGSTLTGNSILITYAADLNGDHIANFLDINAFVNAYQDYIYDEIYNPAADFDHDTDIDDTDTDLFLAAYQSYYE